MTVLDRFLRYVSYDTTSDPHASEETYPSTEKQLVLLAQLKEELLSMGIEAHMDRYGYVTASLPANTLNDNTPIICFLAHVDTSPAVSGTDVKARVITYQGGDIVLDSEGKYIIKKAENPELDEYIGKELVVTDGNTLLGADDKAGVAEIMSMLAHLVAHPECKRPAIKVAFTPDEEIGRGTDFFDVASFGADFGYTVDGGMLGEIEYENFNAASAVLTIQGVSVHPGSAKGKMKNAIELFSAFQQALPASETPATTEGYEGFYMPDEVSGTVEQLTATYIIRDHDRAKFEAKKAHFLQLVDEINQRYGGTYLTAHIEDSYYNMAEIISEQMHLIDNAKIAMTACDVTPRICPIRGGTDGARLSYMGLPCPNLSTGGLNFHGRQEYIPVESLEKMTRVLLAIVALYSKHDWKGEKEYYV